MTSWKASDSAAAFIDEVSVEIGRKGDTAKWKRLLQDNLFDTCGSLYAMECEDWFALGLPLSMFTIMKKRVLAKSEQSSLGKILIKKPFFHLCYITNHKIIDKIKI